MLKKLRIKFIALNMATVAVVLTVVFAAICVVNHRQSVATVDGALNQAIAQASEHQGRQMGKDSLGEGQPESGNGQAAPDDGEAGDSQASDGDMTALSRFNTASISQDVLEQAGEQLAGADEGFGSLSDLGLFYVKRQAGGVMYLAFADMGSASGWRSLAATLAVAEVAALAVFFVISLFFSRWALRPVARAWTQQRRFVADASHDLKTPLTVILANTSIALEHPERSVASQSQWLESTQHEAEAMQSLVGDLLALAKMDEEEAAAQSGAARLALEEVDLSDVIEGEVLQFESVAFERGVKLGSQVEPGIKLRGNEQRLRRLAGTLIDNACKYVDDGGAVDVALSRVGKQAKLEVRNTGAPISPEDLPHVFDRFYRADKARTGGAGGHGLGLAIARAIAEEHGGTLTASSTQAEGTAFTATLPLK